MKKKKVPISKRLVYVKLAPDEVIVTKLPYDFFVPSFKIDLPLKTYNGMPFRLTTVIRATNLKDKKALAKKAFAIAEDLRNADALMDEAATAMTKLIDKVKFLQGEIKILKRDLISATDDGK